LNRGTTEHGHSGAVARSSAGDGSKSLGLGSQRKRGLNTRQVPEALDAGQDTTVEVVSGQSDIHRGIDIGGSGCDLVDVWVFIMEVDGGT